ncbi:Uncharacterized protein BM_BM17552 [Brugia malayi]|uniref:Uncharacterized protein n=1 Tax=Brugia malayi TaxID=6279 RepID=A0A4E9FDI0_BRUMA|nr:Uncharacterized protein BM_BM17552 [Brugia malayi]VIO94847.1 Uncharacterized protein BM_BM17552 [Brugia malayi]
MITRDFGTFLIAIFSFSLFKDSSGLECYICDDENLDEGGDCHEQFRYDCTSYAKNFKPTELIFCRTMRKRVSNDSYTITKECISEQDHYRVFPLRQYSFDEEECDFIEMDGNELAYCLCQKNFCNAKNIVDQFVDFEEKHTEIFAATANGAIIEKHNERFPITLQKYSVQLNYPPIQNIDRNEMNFRYEAAKSELTNGRSNDKIDEIDNDYLNNHFKPQQIYDNSRLSYQMSSFPLKQNYEPTIFAGNITTNFSSLQNRHREEMIEDTGKLRTSEQTSKLFGVKQQNADINENYCYNCVEKLDDPTEDCLDVTIVQCPISKISGRSQMCITKQSHIADDNLYKLEKRCSTDNEENGIIFDEISEGKIACMRTLDASVAYCLCMGHYCNKDSLLIQAEKLAQSQSDDESNSLKNSIFNENTNSIISSTIMHSQIIANNPMQLSTVSSLQNLFNKTNAQ